MQKSWHWNFQIRKQLSYQKIRNNRYACIYTYVHATSTNHKHQSKQKHSWSKVQSGWRDEDHQECNNLFEDPLFMMYCHIMCLFPISFYCFLMAACIVWLIGMHALCCFSFITQSWHQLPHNLVVLLCSCSSFFWMWVIYFDSCSLVLCWLSLCWTGWDVFASAISSLSWWQVQYSYGKYVYWYTDSNRQSLFLFASY